jgi:hypothetical protein
MDKSGNFHHSNYTCGQQRENQNPNWKHFQLDTEVASARVGIR